MCWQRERSIWIHFQRPSCYVWLHSVSHSGDLARYQIIFREPLSMWKTPGTSGRSAFDLFIYFSLHCSLLYYSAFQIFGNLGGIFQWVAWKNGIYLDCSIHYFLTFSTLSFALCPIFCLFCVLVVTFVLTLFISFQGWAVWHWGIPNAGPLLDSKERRYQIFPQRTRVTKIINDMYYVFSYGVVLQNNAS